MRVYHGSIECVKEPDVFHSYRSLDFGKGFYVTKHLGWWICIIPEYGIKNVLLMKSEFIRHMIRLHLLHKGR